VILAVDSSTQWTGVALFNGSQVIGENIWRTVGRHTVELSPAIDALMKQCGVDGSELTALAVATGPGSFTSLRIGIAVVKGLALALRLPVIGIPSLDLLTAVVPGQDLPLAAALQAGRKRLAVIWYKFDGQIWAPSSEMAAVEFEDFQQAIQSPAIVTGEFTPEQRHILERKKRLVHLVSPSQSVRRPAVLAELAWKRFKAGQVDDVVALAPIYLHTAEGL
jgi:tRNA threonylcarbamoyladenosine biosynthesis protein TsaB